MSDEGGDDPREPSGTTSTCDDSKDGSAATAANNIATDSNTASVSSVIVEPLPSDDTNMNGNTRRRYMTHHRKTLERIQVDGFQNTRHKVPDQKRRKHRSYPQRAIGAAQETVAQRTCNDWLEIFLPMTKWIKTYEWKSDLVNDVIAGCTVGIMVIPQSMSYAKLAGLPVEYGLYSALVPVYAYAFFGSSRQLAVGPVALISLLLSTGLTHVLEKTGYTRATTPNYQEMYNTLAIQTSFLVGISYIVLGILRLGFITIFLSRAVISGFTTGAAVIIGMSQVKYIFGYDVKRSDVLHELLIHIFEGISHFSLRTFVVGLMAILALVAMKHIGKTHPKYKWVRAAGPLTVCVVSIILNVIFDLESKGIPVVGKIPKGLPSFTADKWFPLENLDRLMFVVISITLVGFMESIAMGKQLASKHKYELDSSMELIGLGMANFCGSIFHSYPVTGSFSRSAVNNESGAKSGISGMVTATIVGLVLLFLTPVFGKMPLAVLAAIVISGVLGLIDYDEARYLYRVHKFDFCVWVTACLGTMFLGVETGLAIAVGVSLLLVTYESAYPHTAVLGRLPGTNVYRNVKQYPEAESYDGIVMIRIDAPIYFANTQNVREKISKYERNRERQMTERNESVKYVVLEMSPVSHVDTSALHILEDISKNYRERGITLCLANPAIRVMERFVRSGLADEIGRDHIFASIHDCVSWCLDEMDNVESSMPEIDLSEDSIVMEDNATRFDSLSSPALQSAVEKAQPANTSTVGISSSEDFESELTGALLENSDSNKIQKVTFSSLGSGQL